MQTMLTLSLHSLLTVEHGVVGLQTKLVYSIMVHIISGNGHNWNWTTNTIALWPVPYLQ